MAVLIDVLSTQDTGNAFFQVDNSGPLSVVLQPGAGMVANFARLARADGLTTFQNGDNLLVLSMGYTLPLGFERYESEDTGTGKVFIPFGSFALIRSPSGGGLFPLPLMIFPFDNYELSIGNWHNVQDVSANGDIGWQIEGRLPVLAPKIMRISMVNVPAGIPNETIYQVPLWIKVSHTLPLITPT